MDGLDQAGKRTEQKPGGRTTTATKPLPKQSAAKSDTAKDA